MDTELCSLSNLGHLKIVLHNHTFNITSLASCQSTYNVACLCYHYNSSTVPSISVICCQKRHHTPTTLAPAHTPCLFSVDLLTVRQHLVIAHFLLLLLLSGTLFQMMSGVPHHCYFNVLFENMYFVQFTKTLF